MISQWQTMMDNLNDIYYLVRLIIHQISVYLRDLILYKVFWIATGNDNFDASDAKLRGITLRNVTTDIVAFSVICIVLFFLVVLASKCEKSEDQFFTPVGIETLVIKVIDVTEKGNDLNLILVRVKIFKFPNVETLIFLQFTSSVATNLSENPFCVPNTSSSTNCFHACGDSIFSRQRVPKRNFSDEDVARVRFCNETRAARIPKKSIFGLTTSQPQNPQSIQAARKMFHKNNQKWLIRRTRSGHIYGKYPV
ncbi:hypothetical protein K0M31_019588 [Melipona bicolor]|uniref:Uncharacterized protein n=1 Tax=Melipona bicolor TaxID=60889 RepID=A0AA40KRA3_9HYME|nr:hypothetical protein K0M31_019588 [Melipona bicolor]